MRRGLTIVAAARGRETGSGTTPTVSFALPGSEVFAFDLFHARRGLVGGRLARCWVAFRVGSTNYVPHFTQGGSSADPTQHVAALSGYTAVTIALPASTQTSAQVATALISAMSGVGVTVTTDGTDAEGRTICVVTGGSNLVVPTAVDTTDTALRGMWGAQRDDWGGGAVANLNQDGGTDGTGSVHLGSPGSALTRTGRVLGVYMWCHSAMPPRLGASTGPAYSASPGAMTELGEAAADPITGFGGVVLPAAAFADDDVLWAHYRGQTTGGIRYRAFAQSPQGSGDLGTGQVLVWDTTASTNPATPIFSSGTYTPTVATTFNIYVMIGVVFELQDEAGNYPADGSIDTRIGDQNTDPDHGTQTDAGPGVIDLETTHHRISAPQWVNAEITQWSRVVAALGGDETSRTAWYQWADLTVPSTGTHDLLGQQLATLSAGAYSTTTLSTPIPIGTDVLGSNATISMGWNYVRTGGTSVAVYTLPVFIDGAGGSDDSWLAAWEDDRETWHDYIPAACGLTTHGAIEYRTVGGRGTMPTGAPGDTYPDPFNVDPTDDSPSAIPLDWFRVQSPGIVAV